MTVRAKAAHPFDKYQADVSEVRLAKRATTSDFVPSPFRVARDFVEQGEYRRALRVLETAVSEGYESPEVLRLLARAAAHLGDEDRAKEALERALELDPNDVVTNIRYVRALLRTGERP